jgi:type III secretory pathway component EscV
LRLVIGKEQVAVCAQQGVFGFLQVVDGLVDLVDGLFEAVGCQLVVARECGFEGIQAGLKIGKQLSKTEQSD